MVETGRPSVGALVNIVLMQLELSGSIDPYHVPSPVDRLASGDAAAGG